MEKLKHITLKNEVWEFIEGTEQKYAVSNKGRVASFWHSNPIILKPSANRKGYLKVVIYTKDKEISAMPHRLVALYFLPNPEGKLEVNHLNLDKSDNNAENLEWATRLENVRHAVASGVARGFEKGHKVKNRPRGSRVHTSVLNEDQVREIRSDIKAGNTRKATAEKFGIKMSTVESALSYWKHIV